MTMPQPTATSEPSLGRDILHAARYYLGIQWGLLALASLVVAAGLYFGGWGWLVAAGLAPIVLSMLPCLIMCAFGVCTMCKSNKAQSVASNAAADSTTPPAALVGTKADESVVSRSSCCDSTNRPEASP